MYPFGMIMPGRNSNGTESTYRYAYNGMEADAAVKGERNSYTTEFRQYDPRLGRWASLDPMMRYLPSISPYIGFDDNPILYIDPYGLKSSGDNEPNESGEPVILGSEGPNSDPLKDLNLTETENTIPVNDGPIGNTNPKNSDTKNSPDWASKFGFYVHQLANMAAIKFIRENDKSINEDQSKMILKQLNKATVHADSKKFQTGEYAYRHAMRNKNQSVEEAKQLADEFVRERYQWALDHYKKGEYRKAYFQLGVALHALQDATSPAHHGFQEWSDDTSNEEQVGHVLKEMNHPGGDSNLNAVSIWFIRKFINKEELPEGNLFDSIKSD